MSAPSFEKSLQDIVGSQNVRPDEPLVEHTTFRIGGPAQWLVTPRSEDAVSYTHLLRERPHERDARQGGNGGREHFLVELGHPDAPRGNRARFALRHNRTP